MDPQDLTLDIDLIRETGGDDDGEVKSPTCPIQRVEDEVYETTNIREEVMEHIFRVLRDGVQDYNDMIGVAHSLARYAGQLSNVNVDEWNGSRYPSGRFPHYISSLPRPLRLFTEKLSSCRYDEISTHVSILRHNILS